MPCRACGCWSRLVTGWILSKSKDETVIRGTFSFLLLLAALVLGPSAIFQAQRVAAQGASAASLGTGAAQIARAMFSRGVLR